MARFFIDRPIVAIVISIIMVIVGGVAILGLPIAQYPNIVPPEIVINTTYVGADAQTVEQSVATPIEQEMSGVDNMNYMYSLNANNGELKLYVNFDVKTDPNIDQVLAQIRKSQADSKLPQEVPRLRRHGEEVNVIPPHGGEPLFPQRDLRRHLPRQLCLHQPERPDDACAGDRQRHRVRRRPVRHALLGETRPAGEAQHHDPGDRQRHPAAEHGEPCGPDRRRACAPRPGVHLRHQGPGTAGDGGGVREDRAPGQPGRVDRAALGRGPDRARLPDLRHGGPL